MGESLLRKKPEMLEATGLLGDIYCEQERYKEAANIYNEALKMKETIDELLHVGINKLIEENFLKKGDNVVIAGGKKALMNFEPGEVALNSAIGGIIKI